MVPPQRIPTYVPPEPSRHVRNEICSCTLNHNAAPVPLSRRTTTFQTHFSSAEAAGLAVAPRRRVVLGRGCEAFAAACPAVTAAVALAFVLLARPLAPAFTCTAGLAPRGLALLLTGCVTRGPGCVRAGCLGGWAPFPAADAAAAAMAAATAAGESAGEPLFEAEGLVGLRCGAAGFPPPADCLAVPAFAGSDCLAVPCLDAAAEPALAAAAASTAAASADAAAADSSAPAWLGPSASAAALDAGSAPLARCNLERCAEQRTPCK